MACLLYQATIIEAYRYGSRLCHYSYVIMSTMASQITGVSIVYSTVCSSADQRKHQSSAPLVFERGIHRWPLNSLHKGPVTRKMFPFDDVIMHVKFVKLIALSSLGALKNVEATAFSAPNDDKAISTLQLPLVVIFAVLCPIVCITWSLPSPHGSLETAEPSLSAASTRPKTMAPGLSLYQRSEPHSHFETRWN